jgi:hypothetical protein
VNELQELKPAADDFVVVPEDMTIKDSVPFHVHRMKFLHKPSIVRSGGYNMGFLDKFSLGNLGSWLGWTPAKDPVDVLVDSIKDRAVFVGKIQDLANVLVGSSDEKASIPQQKQELPKFFRHIRGKELTYRHDGVSTEFSAKGGLTLYVELDPANKTLAFSYALCHTDENFRKDIGRQVSQGRFESEDWYEIDNLDENLDVVGNIGEAIYFLLHPELANPNVKGPKFSSMSEKTNEYELKQIYERI